MQVNSPMKKVNAKTGAAMIWSPSIFFRIVATLTPGKRRSSIAYQKWLSGPNIKPVVPSRPAQHSTDDDHTPKAQCGIGVARFTDASIYRDTFPAIRIAILFFIITMFFWTMIFVISGIVPPLVVKHFEAATNNWESKSVVRGEGAVRVSKGDTCPYLEVHWTRVD